MATSLDFSGALGSHRLVNREGVWPGEKGYSAGAMEGGHGEAGAGEGQENNLDSEPWGGAGKGQRKTQRHLRTGVVSQELEASFPSSVAAALLGCQFKFILTSVVQMRKLRPSEGRDLPRATLPVRDRARPASRSHSIQDLSTSFRESDGARRGAQGHLGGRFPQAFSSQSPLSSPDHGPLG